MKGWVLLFVIFSVFVNAQTVYKTPSGKKYHLSSCRMVENVSSKLSVEKALEMGLDPCKICGPPTRNVQSFVSTPKSTNGTSPSTVQCKGTTKAGNRCKHRTNIGNGYCFQHQP